MTPVPLNALPLDEIKTMAVEQGLIFVHNQATYQTAESFSLHHERTCVCASEHLGIIEHYIFGFRDGRTRPRPEAHVARERLRDLCYRLRGVQGDSVRYALIELMEDFITPLTREPS